MADVRAFRSGNWSDVTATSPWWNGTAIFAPAAADVVYTSNFTITADTTATVNTLLNASATSRVWKDGGTAAVAAGGTVQLGNGIILTANGGGFQSANGTLLTLSGTNSSELVGGSLGAHSSGAGVGVVHSGSGVLTYTGSASPGWGTGTYCINLTGSGSCVLNGTFSGAGGGSINTEAVRNSSAAGSITINGSVTGGVGVGVVNASTGNFTVNGSITAGASQAGANNASTGTFIVTGGGNITAVNGVPGFTSANVNAANRLSCSFISSPNGTAAVYALKYIASANLSTAPANAKSRYALNGTSTYVDMFTSDNNPNGGVATTDVRLGTPYGGGLVGTCAVPPASAVAAGTAVDNTSGTATLTAANVRAALGMASANMDTQLAVLSNLDTTVSSRLAPSGTLATVVTLTNAPTVPTAAAIASQVRTELATELARVDVATSTRLATSGYTAPSAAPTVTAIRQEMDSNSTKLANLDATVSSRLASSAYTAPSNSDVAAIKAKTDLLNTDRLAQASTVATTGAQIAAALS